MRNTRVIAAAAAAVLSGAALLAGCTAPRAQTAAAKPAATNCLPAPYQETLFLRGRFTEGVAREDYALQWRCNAYLINVDLSGEQTFRIQDARLGGGVLFGGPPGATTALQPNTAFALSGGQRADAGELKYVFAGPATVRLDFGGAGGKPTVTIGAKSFVDVDEKPIDDAAALSLRYDSRDSAHKHPFGAIVAGKEIEVALSAKPGIARATLVIETRRLEGWQEVLEYRELARVPLTRVANGVDERWEGKYKFDEIGVYGYYFEIESGGRRYLYTNNADPVPFTREVGSNGRGAVINAPTDTARIRRYRQTVYRADYRVPDWAHDAVYYYIFPDRFRNGDRGNDPKPGVDKFHAGTVEFHKNWLDKPWLPRSGDGSDGEYSNDFFGGDLAGITEKLDYIRALGANALYINPIFTASSNHKYDTADYREIDPHFGTTVEFEKLNREAAKRGMRVILDTSLNHTGRDSLYFNRYGNFPAGGAFDHGKINPDSKYAKWYLFYADETDPDRQYKGWAGVADLPELDKSQRSLRDFFYGRDGVMQLWLGHGLSGWRMDVTPWIPDDFWREWRTAVKQAKPDAVAVAETFFDASKYFLGDEFDSTMNYIFRSSVVAYANGAKAGEIYRNIELMRENYPPQAFYALMNLIDSHDSARALHDFGWRDEAKDSSETVALAKRRLRLAAFFQMTSPGAPAIYYGDEVGVTGGDDPFDRGTYPWPDLGGKPDEALLAEYKKLTRLRHAEPVLRRGSLDAPIYIDDRVIVLARRDGAQWALVAMNNDAAPRTLKVTLPAAIATAHFRDALTGTKLAAAAGTLELTVPAMYGSVLLSPDNAPANKRTSAK